MIQWPQKNASIPIRNEDFFFRFHPHLFVLIPVAPDLFSEAQGLVSESQFRGAGSSHLAINGQLLRSNSPGEDFMVDLSSEKWGFHAI